MKFARHSSRFAFGVCSRTTIRSAQQRTPSYGGVASLIAARSAGVQAFSASWMGVEGCGSLMMDQPSFLDFALLPLSLRLKRSRQALDVLDGTEQVAQGI